MAEFNFNAMQQAVHDAHASMTDKHAEPSDVQYIEPSAPGAYSSHQAIVQERMSQLDAMQIFQARADIACQLEAQRQQAADAVSEQIDADLAASPFSAVDIPMLKPDAVVRLANGAEQVVEYKTSPDVNHSTEPSPPPAEPGKPKTARERVQVALDGTPGINIDNCPLLLWLAVNRVNVDASAKGYKFERDEFGYEYLRPVSGSKSVVKVKIDVPERIPRMHNGEHIVVTAEQLRAARADIVAYINAPGRSDMTEQLLSACADVLTVPAKDIKRKVPARVIEAPVTEVSMLDALRIHMQANGFKTFGNRGAFDWQWPYRDDANGWRVFAALSYDGKNLTYSYAPDRQALKDWELLPHGRVNMTEFTRTNRTRIAARDYVRVEQLLNSAASLAFTDETIRVPFFDAVNGCTALIDLGAAFLIGYAGLTFHPEAVALLNQTMQPADGTWHRLIHTFLITELIKNNAICDEQTRMIYSQSVARYIVGLFTK